MRMMKMMKMKMEEGVVSMAFARSAEEICCDGDANKPSAIC